MKYKFKLLFILLTIIFVSFPSICFSGMKTVTGEYCDVYLGDMKNKKELVEFRQTIKDSSIEECIFSFDKSYKDVVWFSGDNRSQIVRNLSRYLEKIVPIGHTENGRKICDKVRITFDPDVLDKYIRQNSYRTFEEYRSDNPIPKLNIISGWIKDIDLVLSNRNDNINLGLIIETKSPDIQGDKKDQLENEQEKQFFNMIERNKDKYKYIDRRHLKTILEEQKFSSSGLTESETVKLGKLLNLDIIVLRLIYENSRVTKVLKVDTGEVLLFKTYEEKETNKKGWISFGKNDLGDFYYDENSMTNVSSNVIKVWIGIEYSQYTRSTKVGLSKIHHDIFLIKVDCNSKIMESSRVISYNDMNLVVDEEISTTPVIFDTVPNSVGSFLLGKICK